MILQCDLGCLFVSMRKGTLTLDHMRKLQYSGTGTLQHPFSHSAGEEEGDISLLFIKYFFKKKDNISLGMK